MRLQIIIICDLPLSDLSTYYNSYLHISSSAALWVYVPYCLMSCVHGVCKITLQALCQRL